MDSRSIIKHNLVKQENIRLAEMALKRLTRESAKLDSISRDFPHLFSPEKVKQIKQRKESLISPTLKSNLKTLPTLQSCEHLSVDENVNCINKQDEQYSFWNVKKKNAKSLNSDMSTEKLLMVPLQARVVGKQKFKKNGKKGRRTTNSENSTENNTLIEILNKKSDNLIHAEIELTNNYTLNDEIIDPQQSSTDIKFKTISTSNNDPANSDIAQKKYQFVVSELKNILDEKNKNFKIDTSMMECTDPLPLQVISDGSDLPSSCSSSPKRSEGSQKNRVRFSPIRTVTKIWDNDDTTRIVVVEEQATSSTSDRPSTTTDKCPELQNTIIAYNWTTSIALQNEDQEIVSEYDDHDNHERNSSDVDDSIRDKDEYEVAMESQSLFLSVLLYPSATSTNQYAINIKTKVNRRSETNTILRTYQDFQGLYEDLKAGGVITAIAFPQQQWPIFSWLRWESSKFQYSLRYDLDVWLNSVLEASQKSGNLFIRWTLLRFLLIGTI